MTELNKALELAKRIAGAVNHQDNPIMSDAKEVSRALLELVAEREPVMVIDNPLSSRRARCPNCSGPLIGPEAERFCPGCGRPLVWEKAGGQ